MFDTSSRAFGLNLNVYAQTAASVQAAEALEYLGRELTLVGRASGRGRPDEHQLRRPVRQLGGQPVHPEDLARALSVRSTRP